MRSPPSIVRRRLIAAAGGASAWLGVTGLAWSGALPRMTDGPFYPSLAYRARALDWDADLTTVRGRAPDGQPLPRALGEHLDLHGVVVDLDGRSIDGTEIEIWQCDVHGSYRHPNGARDRIDAGFQGFGSTRSDGQGRYRFRTIRPVPYPGRTPHIHVKLRNPAFGELTSQLFVAGEASNASDILYGSLSDTERADVALRLQRATADDSLTWVAERDLHVGR